MDSKARNCQNNLKKMSPYATKVNQRKIHALGERSFFSVALIAQILSSGICFLIIYQNIKVIKYGNFHASIQNAIIIAGKKGIVFNSEFRIQNSENFLPSTFHLPQIYCSPARINPMILLKSMKSIKTFIMVRNENDRLWNERTMGISIHIATAR